MKSSSEGKQKTFEWVIVKNPKRILDIGAGEGTYLKMIKPFLPSSFWVGVEVWEPLVEEYKLEKFYDDIILKDARKIEYEDIGKYDLAILGDILEHMKKSDAVSLVEKLFSCTETIIISIPIVFWPQGLESGNPWNIHIKPDWSDKEVEETWGKYIIDKCVGEKIGVYLLEKKWI